MPGDYNLSVREHLVPLPLSLNSSNSLYADLLEAQTGAPKWMRGPQCQRCPC